MSRCQHCFRLTHSEHLKVYFSSEDFEKVEELFRSKEWSGAYLYDHSKDEIGLLKCGDIYIHFCMIRKEDKDGPGNKKSQEIYR